MSTNVVISKEPKTMGMFSNIKQMFRLMQQRRLFIFLAFLEIIRGFLLLQGEAWGLKWLADGCVYKDSHLFFSGIVLLITTMSLSTIAVFSVDYTSMKITVKAKSDIRKRLVNSSLYTDIFKFSSFNTGDLLYRLNLNVNEMIELYRSVHFFIGSFGKVISSMVVGFVLSWQLSITIMILGLLKIWADKTVIRNLQDVIIKIKELESGLIKEVLEYIKGSIFFRMFGNEAKVLAKFVGANRQFGEENMNEARVNARMTIIGKSFQFVTILAVLTMGGIFVVKGRMTLGALTAFIALYDNLINPYKFIGNFLKDYKTLSVSYDRIDEIIRLEREESEWGKLSKDIKQDELLDKQFSLNIDNLSFKYPEGSQILDNLNFEARSGQVTYLVGKSGIGKTTLFKILIGLYKPEKGEIYLTVDGTRQKGGKDLFTYVSQNIFLFNGSVKENIVLDSGEVDEERLYRAAKEAGIHDFICTLSSGYDTVLTDGGKQLSGGQKCRIALARAFYRPTPILLLDEVFASLDNNTIELIQKSIEQLCQENRCVLMISHRHEWINPDARVFEIK